MMKYLLVLFMLGFFSCQHETHSNDTRIKILSVLNEQQQAWNKGNLEEYMGGYLQSDSLRFASGGNLSYGWHATLERYKAGYPDNQTMGKLTFSEIDIRLLSADYALVFGKWELERETDNPWGLFTLIFKRTHEGWRIVHDHTSSDN
jgi:ketosteroid isomerase-like protein